jgi:hypothetical protein
MEDGDETGLRDKGQFLGGVAGPLPKQGEIPQHQDKFHNSFLKNHRNFTYSRPSAVKRAFQNNSYFLTKKAKSIRSKAMKKSKYFIIVLAILGSLNSIAGADCDPNELIRSMHEFLIRQMEVFDLIRPPEQPPLVQTYGWNLDLPFPPPELNPPPYCNGYRAPIPMWPEPWKVPYRGDSYDQSLAAIWFTHQAWLDFLKGRGCTENLTRVRKLLDALILLEDHDPYADGRVRAAYWANNLLDPGSSIMDPAAGTGNIAWFGIALTRFCWVAQKTGFLDANTITHYFETAKKKANWILEHCKSSHCLCGFTGGYQGWGQTRITWKGTEHNIGVFVLGRNLYHLDGDPKWEQMAEEAACFVRHMYVDLDGQCGYYMTGTLDDGCTPKPSPIPADAQAWTALARCGHIKIDTDERAKHAMQWLMENLKDRCECDFMPLPCDGIKFSDKGKNFQSEVTAGAAMALRHIDVDGCCCEDGNCLLNCLDWVRRNASPPYDGIEDGNGIVATPCPEGAYTGYGSWYYRLLHVASSAWTGLAAMVCQGDPTANPLMPLGCTATQLALDIKPSSCPNPLNPKSKGVLPVAVLGSEDFDVSNIDPASIRLKYGDDSEGVAPLRSSLEDVATPVVNGNECQCNTAGPDGHTDLTVKFDTQQVLAAIGDVNSGDVLQLDLTGLLNDGTPIEGTDCIVVVGNFKAFKKGDINKDGITNIVDFTLMAETWLESTIIQEE